MILDIIDIRRRARGLATGEYITTAPAGPQFAGHQPGRYALVRRKRGWNILGWNAGHGCWECGGWTSKNAYEATRKAGGPEFRSLKAALAALREQMDMDEIG